MADVAPSGTEPSGTQSPGVLSKIADTVKKYNPLGVVKDAAGALNDSANYNESNDAFIPLAPDATGEQATNAVKSLEPATADALRGTTQAAQYQQNVLTPTAEQAKNSGVSQQQSGLRVTNDARTEYEDAVRQTNQKTYDVEQAIRTADEAASIDPNGPQGYLGRMGVGQKTIAAIGLLISGAGAGLTGRPNMAYESLQKNIDRDIQNQKDIFLQKMELVAKQKGLLQSAQDRQNLALAALNGATIVVTTGVNNALNGAQAQVVGGTSNDLANVTKNAIQQKNVQALSDYNQNYIKTIKSGNAKNAKLLGIAADVVSEHLGTGPIGLNKKPLDQAKSSDPNNAVFNSSAPPSPQDKFADVFRQQSDARNKAANTSPTAPNFLDALSKSKGSN